MEPVGTAEFDALARSQSPEDILGSPKNRPLYCLRDGGQEFTCHASVLSWLGYDTY